MSRRATDDLASIRARLVGRQQLEIVEASRDAWHREATELRALLQSLASRAAGVLADNSTANRARLGDTVDDAYARTSLLPPK
jgi:hypothetical protein